jgi:hypothetical protein
VGVDRPERNVLPQLDKVPRLEYKKSMGFTDLRVPILNVECKKQELDRAGYKWIELSPEEAGCPADLKMHETILRISHPVK